MIALLETQKGFQPVVPLLSCNGTECKQSTNEFAPAHLTPDGNPIRAPHQQPQLLPMGCSGELCVGLDPAPEQLRESRAEANGPGPGSRFDLFVSV